MFSSCSSEWVVARGASGSQLAILRNDDLYVGSSELNRGDMVEEKRMNVYFIRQNQFWQGVCLTIVTV
ncbi:hypothetical protein HZH66_002202 [Vespula vulgaris]|uniref:Uncharacterized protein n=1 Tax=Vespula vulgaris TaxID=7454 RepID=A0A834KJ93_VESVU|nr:hypothetical protein HZH66_002202 [Vespula vulgaris]